MKTPQPKTMSRRAPRPVRVPPPLTRGTEKFEGSSVLSEFEGDFGILLWQSLRNVMLWSATEPARRKGLFAPGAEERRRVKLLSTEVDDVLRAPLAVIARLLADPAGADRRRVAAACQRIGEWAEEQGKLATALAFIQAAALTSNEARLSYAVGRLARQRAEYPRAETWYRRAILLGRQSGDWESYAQAFVGLGNLFMQRGSVPSAHKSYLRAYRAAKRKGLRNVQGLALHELFGVAVERDNARDAEELAASALKAYGAGHALLPSLAHDVAYFWMVRGYFRPALMVLSALRPHFQRSHEQALIQAHIARSAAGAGDEVTYEEAWRKAWDSTANAELMERSAAVFLSLAIGASTLGDWDRASLAAGRAAEAAAARDEQAVKASAEAVLEAAAEQVSAAPPQKPADEPWMIDHAGTLAENFARSLKAVATAR